MKYSTSAAMTAKEIREKSEPWLRFIRNTDRMFLAAKRKAALRAVAGTEHQPRNEK